MINQSTVNFASALVAVGAYFLAHYFMWSEPALLGVAAAAWLVDDYCFRNWTRFSVYPIYPIGAALVVANAELTLWTVRGLGVSYL
jgi:hypothetical protein